METIQKHLRSEVTKEKQITTCCVWLDSFAYGIGINKFNRSYDLDIYRKVIQSYFMIDISIESFLEAIKKKGFKTISNNKGITLVNFKIQQSKIIINGRKINTHVLRDLQKNFREVC